MKNAKQNVTMTQLRELLESQNYKCAYTGTDLTPDTASVDHIIPLSRGGTNQIKNLAIIRHDLNAAKGAMTLAEFHQLCLMFIEKYPTGEHLPSGETKTDPGCIARQRKELLQET